MSTTLLVTDLAHVSPTVPIFWERLLNESMGSLTLYLGHVNWYLETAAMCDKIIHSVKDWNSNKTIDITGFKGVYILFGQNMPFFF